MPLDTRINQALAEVAQEHGMAFGLSRHYPTGHVIVTLVAPDDATRVTGVLPVDDTLRKRLTDLGHTRAGLRRILRDDAFDAQGARNPARDLCRLGLVACHTLAEALPEVTIRAGLAAQVSFDHPGVCARAEGAPAATVSLIPDQVRLLWQFTPVERYARAYHLFRRQIAPVDRQRASS